MRASWVKVRISRVRVRVRVRVMIRVGVRNRVRLASSNRSVDAGLLPWGVCIVFIGAADVHTD